MRDEIRRGTTLAGALLLACLASFSACTTVSVEVDHDRDADFSGLETWRWHDETVARDDVPAFDEEAFDRALRASVERELAAKGFVRKDAPPTDFEVGYHTAIETRTDFQRTADRYGYTAASVRDHQYVSEYREGTLLLDVSVDAGRRLIWRGTAQARVYEQGTEAQRRERLDEAVHRMLKGFPP